MFRLFAPLLAALLAAPMMLTATAAADPAPPTFAAPETMPNPDSICAEPGGYYTNLADPTQFFQCDMDKHGFHHNCPENQVFNEAASVCDWPGNVQTPSDRSLSRPQVVNGKVTASLDDQERKPIAGSGVLFTTAGGFKLCEAITDTEGVASCDPNPIGDVAAAVSRGDVVASTTLVNTDTGQPMTYPVYTN